MLKLKLFCALPPNEVFRERMCVQVADIPFVYNYIVNRSTLVRVKIDICTQISQTTNVLASWTPVRIAILALLSSIGQSPFGKTTTFRRGPQVFGTPMC